MSRAAGRHEVGAPVTRVRPLRWDEDKRATAARLDQLEPGWHVMYGLWSRRFFAIAICCPVALMVEALTAEELRERMREGESEAMAARGPGSLRVA
ncbi:hypothetical protein Ssi03_50190 [Sphaerisporangium siamense]|uniref:Uncharacterized protein n=1 Tax=Sphaerisporangium siamense TaxID=795645 RepID=A0A7W7D3F8_9ACTN|nr:hypothetical protein [Sphaerisporangium siamense]MBB4699615.1 hypothetical protein [Sphaerisporangium siamense]GII87029.1 hypothetical protein Ssi03_50190 [Sphaerisporangium siamense]